MGSCCNANPTQGPGVTPEQTPDPTAQKERTSPPRRSKKAADNKTAKQSFNGKTYACISCKNGHRVKQCDHGYDRPVSATNQPGRPSSGSKRKCTCPKDCACMNKDNCKCEKNCVCVEAMYLIVHVSKKTSPKLQHKLPHIDRAPSPVISRVNEKGQEEFLQKVYTDLSGKPLSDEETKRRIEERESREQRDQVSKMDIKTERSPTSPSDFDVLSYQQVASPIPLNLHQTHQPSPLGLLSPTPTHPTTPAFDDAMTPWPETPAPSCCQHASNTSQTPYVMPVFPAQNLQPVRAATAGCNCGTACQCIHCPEHANNAATRQYNQQQLSHMASNSYLPSGHQIPGPLFRPEVPQASCMGGPTTFRLSSRPPQPMELSHMFPDAQPGSYIMHYEVKRNAQNGHLQFVNEMDESYNIPDLSNDVQFQGMNMDDNVNHLDLDFDTFMGDDSIGWDNVTIGDANVSQIPGSLAQSQRSSYNSGGLIPHPVMQYQQPPSVLHGENGSSNTFLDINMPQFVPGFAAGQDLMIPQSVPRAIIPQQHVRDRPNGNSGEPWMQDFTTDGPFMGHPTSPLPMASSPVSTGAF